MMPWIKDLFKKANAPENLEKLLIHYGVKFRSGALQLSNLRCPLPVHPVKSTTSLSVNFEKGEWQCFNTECNAFREGQKLGNPVGFVIAMENCSAGEAAKKVLEICNPEMKKPPLKTEAFSQNQNSHPEATTEDRGMQGKSTKVYRNIGFGQPPVIEKIPPKPVLRSSGVTGLEPVPPVSSTRSEPVKVKGYCKDVDAWFDSLISDPPDWQKIRNAVKQRLIESYKNGKQAGSN